MTKKKAKTDVVNKSLTISYTEEVTAFKTSSKGAILFKLPITMHGAWSDHRVARALHMAYVKGFEAASASATKPTKAWTIKPDGGVVKEVNGKEVPLSTKYAKGTLKRKEK